MMFHYVSMTYSMTHPFHLEWLSKTVFILMGVRILSSTERKGKGKKGSATSANLTHRSPPSFYHPWRLVYCTVCASVFFFFLFFGVYLLSKMFHFLNLSFIQESTSSDLEQSPVQFHLACWCRRHLQHICVWGYLSLFLNLTPRGCPRMDLCVTPLLCVFFFRPPLTKDTKMSLFCVPAAALIWRQG